MGTRNGIPLINHFYCTNLSVGQNKLNIKMMFECCFFSMILQESPPDLPYPRPLSHDVGQSGGLGKGRYEAQGYLVPVEMVNTMNSVKAICAEYINHKSCWRMQRQ